MRIDALIFDADGTLVDSEVAGLDVLHELACAQGLRKMSFRVFKPLTSAISRACR